MIVRANPAPPISCMRLKASTAALLISGSGACAIIMWIYEITSKANFSGMDTHLLDTTFRFKVINGGREWWVTPIKGAVFYTNEDRQKKYYRRCDGASEYGLVGQLTISLTISECTAETMLSFYLMHGAESTRAQRETSVLYYPAIPVATSEK